MTKIQLTRFFRASIALLSSLLFFQSALADEKKIEFASLDKDHPYRVSGILYSPKNAAIPAPAIVMVHGTAGIDSRGTFYRKPIVDAGIAVFEVDFKTGVYSGPLDRPSPEAVLAMGFAALKELRQLPGIDRDRIGILGFSMGGHLTVGSAFEQNQRTWLGDEKGFAVHVAFYPVCKAFLKRSSFKLTGAPMIIFYGSEDSYGDAESAPQLKERLKAQTGFDLLTVEYPGAAHGFNRNAPPITYRDPAAIGQKGYMRWDADASHDSLQRTLSFLREKLSAAK